MFRIEAREIIMDLQPFPVRHAANANAARDAPYQEAQRRILDRQTCARAKAEISAWPGYAPTPLVALAGLAKALDIGALLYKDESRRFGLKSFKALGGAYAVLRVIQTRLRDDHGIEGTGASDLIAGDHRDLVTGVTVAAATDGNHGRAVAWGAQMFGCPCIIYLHANVSTVRELEIAKYGATIRRVEGSYDDSVRQCAAECRAEGWQVVADTSAGGVDWSVTCTVLQGYALMIDEVMDQIQGQTPLTHVMVQGGVGGLAAAVAGYLWERLGSDRPRLIVVEPARADCIFRSVAAGRPTLVPGDTETFMACLSAGEISLVAWEILKIAADHVIALPDEAAEEAMRLLATGVDGDPSIVAGESGCAATAGLVAAALDGTVRMALELEADSRVLVVGSEGATDPEIYQRVVGLAAAELEA